MPKTKKVTLSVHRAIIHKSCPWSLAELLSEIKDQEEPKGQIVRRGLWDKTAVKFPQFPQTNQAIAALFALYEEGAKKVQ